METIQYEELIGKTFDKVYQVSDDQLIFEQTNGAKYRFHHIQDCCECVTIDDICGEENGDGDQPRTFAEQEDMGEL
jgi:hypothetical protein